MEFETISAEDLGIIGKFTPEGWAEITPKIEFYIQSDFCYPVKLVANNDIIGIGTAVFFETTSWIAHLIVHEKHRNHGYGTKILEYLCDYCKNHGYKTILLSATNMGYPLYIKYGFTVQTEYVQYEKTRELDHAINGNIHKIEPHDYENIYELDKMITGENRQRLLIQFVNDGFVYKNKEKVLGFYLPNLGDGPVIALDDEAGIALLRLRVINKKQSILTVDNITGNTYFQENGFKEIKRTKKMIYGNNIDCKNNHIYNRTGGNFG